MPGLSIRTEAFGRLGVAGRNESDMGSVLYDCLRYGKM